MVIVKLSGGIGNQFFQYAVGRCIAHKLNTELKLDKSKIKISNDLKPKGHRYYRLKAFNIQENFATPEEIQHVSENGIIPPPLPSLEDCKQDILIQGSWMMPSEKYYEDTIDIIRKEFTLKNPLSPSATVYKQKILSAECSVSMHFRHGDYIYNPNFKNEIWASILPLDYYYTCINILKQRYRRFFTLFVFSDNLQWCKENLRLDVPTEFVSVTGAMRDVEELYLMSICHHNIVANSTFSHFAASMNSHDDKKCLFPQASDAQTVQQYLHWLKTNTTLLLDRTTWIGVPFDYFNQPAVEMRPYFSILLVVNNNIETVADTLNSIIGQDYKYFELIIIDNASTDGSSRICREVAKAHDNVTLIKLHGKISNGAAWNKAFDIAQGYYVMFLKSGDRIFPDALTSLYIANERILADVVNSAVWLKENADGDIDIADKKFVMEKFSAFPNFQGVFRDKLDKQTLLRIFTNEGTFPPFGTRIFERNFLLEHGIEFKEKISEDAEALFTLEAMFQTDEIIFISNIFYVAPRDKA